MDIEKALGATGITAYLEAGGTLESAEAMAAHEGPRATKLYDRAGGCCPNSIGTAPTVDEMTWMRSNGVQFDFRGRDL